MRQVNERAPRTPDMAVPARAGRWTVADGLVRGRR